jgi:hypothetical protein
MAMYIVFEVNKIEPKNEKSEKIWIFFCFSRSTTPWIIEIGTLGELYTLLG